MRSKVGQGENTVEQVNESEVDTIYTAKKVLAIKYGDESDSDDEDCEFQLPKGLETNDIVYVHKRPRRESLPEIDKAKLRNIPSAERKRINYLRNKIRKN